MPIIPAVYLSGVARCKRRDYSWLQLFLLPLDLALVFRWCSCFRITIAVFPSRLEWL